MIKKKLMVSLLTVSLIAASFVPAYGAEFASEPTETVFSAGEELVLEEPEALDEVYEVSEAKENAQLIAMKWVKKPSEPFFYSGLNIFEPAEIGGKYVASGEGLTDGKVKLTYSDGFTEVVNIGRPNRYGELVKAFFYVPNKNQPKPGKYKGIVKVESTENVRLTTDIEVRSINKIPLIKGKGSKTVSYSYHNTWVRLKTGSTRVYRIKADIKANLEEPGVAFLIRKRGTMETQFLEDGRQTFLEPNTEYLIFLAGTEEKKGTITYTVTPGRFDISKCFGMSPKLKSETAVYTGKPIKMPAELKMYVTLLKPGKDYTLSYKNNVKIGNNATVIFTGKGEYTGTIKKTFRIVPRKVAFQSAKKTGDTSAKLTWKKVSGATGYVVYRTTGKKWVKVANVKGTSFTDEGLEKGVSYKYKVRAYSKVGRKNIYGAYSSTKTVK